MVKVFCSNTKQNQHQWNEPFLVIPKMPLNKSNNWSATANRLSQFVMLSHSMHRLSKYDNNFAWPSFNSSATEWSNPLVFSVKKSWSKIWRGKKKIQIKLYKFRKKNKENQFINWSYSPDTWKKCWYHSIDGHTTHPEHKQSNYHSQFVRCDEFFSTQLNLN